MKKFASLIILSIFVLFPTSVSAVCPVCTVAVAGGLGISRRLGIDDTISSVWIGGLIISSGLWLADWIGKRKWKIPHKKLASILLFYLFAIPPLYWAKMIGVANNNLWGVDKILLGIIIGSVIFLLGVSTDKFLRTINNDKVYIYYQKVIIPVLYLLITSLIFYLITN